MEEYELRNDRHPLPLYSYNATTERKSDRGPRKVKFNAQVKKYPIPARKFTKVEFHTNKHKLQLIAKNHMERKWLKTFGCQDIIDTIKEWDEDLNALGGEKNDKLKAYLNTFIKEWDEKINALDEKDSKKIEAFIKEWSEKFKELIQVLQEYTNVPSESFILNAFRINLTKSKVITIAACGIAIACALVYKSQEALKY